MTANALPVGYASRNRGARVTGQKVHLIWAHKRDGEIVGMSPLCGCTQGQFSATVNAKLTEADVTCGKCVIIAERRAQRCEAA